MTRKALIKLLEKHDAYRAEAYVEELYASIKRREIEVCECESANRELAVIKRIAIVEVVFKWPRAFGFMSRLIELKRRIDGKEQVCSRNDGIGKKILVGENPINAARRCISRKLRMRGLEPVSTGRVDTKITVIPKFGFLPVIEHRFFFRVEMSEEKFESQFGKHRLSSNGVLKHSLFTWIPEFSVV